MADVTRQMYIAVGDSGQIAYSEADPGNNIEIGIDWKVVTQEDDPSVP